MLDAFFGAWVCSGFTLIVFSLVGIVNIFNPIQWVIGYTVDHIMVSFQVKFLDVLLIIQAFDWKLIAFSSPLHSAEGGR